MLTKWPA